MRINNMLPVTLFAVSLFLASSICAQTNTSKSSFKPKPSYAAHLFVGQVLFGTGDVRGYGLLVAVEKSIFKKSVRPYPTFQVGFGLNFETGIRKPINILYPSGVFEESSYGQTSKTSGWATFKYHPFKHSMDGFSVTVGPTLGITQATSEKSVSFSYDPFLGVIRKSVLKTENHFGMGYRIALQQQFLIKDHVTIGFRADFSNDVYGDINTFLGGGIGYKF
ncbi:MAG: hypothetical protein RL070_1374 [Bacteroidota bacterium]|jgi:hypothetical protein